MSEKHPNGRITNSDLEMAGLLLLWLVMEEVCDLNSGSRVAFLAITKLLCIGSNDSIKEFIGGRTIVANTGFTL